MPPDFEHRLKSERRSVYHSCGVKVFQTTPDDCRLCSAKGTQKSNIAPSFACKQKGTLIICYISGITPVFDRPIIFGRPVIFGRPIIFRPARHIRPDRLIWRPVIFGRPVILIRPDIFGGPVVFAGP